MKRWRIVTLAWLAVAFLLIGLCGQEPGAEKRKEAGSGQQATGSQCGMRSRRTGETGNRTHGDEGTRGQEDKGAMEKGPALRIFWRGQSAKSA